MDLRELSSGYINWDNNTYRALKRWLYQVSINGAISILVLNNT